VESKDPGDACWQMLLGAFRPQTTTEYKKSQTPSGARPSKIVFSGFGGRKAPNSMGKISTLEVLRLRATKLSVCDKSAKRFAQDDGFVGGLEIHWLDIHRKSQRLSG
jgi:hypothetical protein